MRKGADNGVADGCVHRNREPEGDHGDDEAIFDRCGAALILCETKKKSACFHYHWVAPLIEEERSDAKEIVAQLRGERPIDRRHVESEKLGRRRPANRLAFPAMWPAIPFAAEKKEKEQARVAFDTEPERRETMMLGRNAEFFLELPHGSVAGVFPVFDFPTGKFPKTT